MERRRLGKTGLEVSLLGFGCGAVGGLMTNGDPADQERAVARGGKDAPIDERLSGTLGAEVVAILKGAHIIRTHDVKACVDAARLADLAG